MANWTQKHRPSRFEEVLGQDGVRDALAELIRDKEAASVALVGPSGVGKTTLAKIYAQAMACETPARTGSPCGVCGACAAIIAGERLLGYHEVPPAQQHTSAIRGLVGDGAGPGLSGLARSVVVLDDADDLRGWRPLKGALEDRLAKRAFIFTFDELDHLPPAIRDRLRVFELRRPTTRDLCEAMRRACLAERVNCEAKALELIARASENFRQAIAEAEMLARRGDITTARVLRQARSPRWAWLEDYVDRLGGADIAGQVRALRRSPLVPNATVTALVEGLVWLRTGEGGEGSVRAEARRLRMLERFHCAAEALSIATPVLWDMAGTFWRGVPALQSAAALEVAAIQFWNQIEAKRLGLRTQADIGGDGPVLEAPTAMPRLAKASRINGAEEAPEFLSWDQVVGLYEAATFALQVYWAPFNTQIEIRWSEEANFRPGGLSTGIDRFAQALQRRVEQLGCVEVGGRFTRLLLNEAESDGTVVTTIVGHVPPRHRADLEKWLMRRALKGDLSLVTPPQRRGIDASIQLHWALLRRLWRGVDPELRVAGEFLVLDLLQVPGAKRGPAGKVSVRRFSASQNISEGAQRQLSRVGLPHVSALAEGQWKWVAQGWERLQFEARARAGFGLAEIAILNSRKSADAAIRTTEINEKILQNQRDMSVLCAPPWARDGLTIDDFEREIAEINPLFAELVPDPA